MSADANAVVRRPRTSNGRVATSTATTSSATTEAPQRVACARIRDVVEDALEEAESAGASASGEGRGAPSNTTGARSARAA